jgi:hypothetical protein
MLVRELIEELKSVNPEAEVHHTYNYGDHGRTTVAPAIHRVEEGHVVHSGYHDMDKVVDEDSEDDLRYSKRSEWREVVLLS